MNFRLHKLVLAAKRGNEVIRFEDFTYFYGRMGAGKSSIPRLIDYCLGGGLEMTPALQSEFVSCTLELTIENTLVRIERHKDSPQARITYEQDHYVDFLIPVRDANGTVIPGEEIEVLSDLIFRLAGITPPKVRRSKIQEDSPLERLSFRSLYWYTFLSQELLDSSFFNLEVEAAFYKRNKSRDVLRFIIGFHQEKVTETEIALEENRINRKALSESTKALQTALDDAGIQNEDEIRKNLAKTIDRIAKADRQLKIIREDTNRLRLHAVEEIRHRAQKITDELSILENAVRSVEVSISNNERHLHEITILKFKFKRVAAAKSVLEGVQFSHCPRCTQLLPLRQSTDCSICGQPDEYIDRDTSNYDEAEKDAESRVKELQDLILRQKVELKTLRSTLAQTQQSKGKIDSEYSAASKEYDSVYLSRALTIEREKAFNQKAIQDLETWLKILNNLTLQRQRIDKFADEESRLRRELKELRYAAQKNFGNLKRLEDLFLDCLLKTKIPGFSRRDAVTIRPPDFLPQIVSPETGDLLISSFSNLGSGGKKTLFKCCFAVAVHRLAIEIGSILPKLLIIDSPMKNISERENPEQFEGFYEMLYGLAESELNDTQIIIVDNELYRPDQEHSFSFKARHMVPFEDGIIPGADELPLISYYKGI